MKNRSTKKALIFRKLSRNKTLSLAVLFVISMTAYSQEVGIGTATPGAKLHVEVKPGYTNPLLKVNVQGSSVPHLVVLPNGNVGIGVASPSEALDVSGNVRFSGSLMPGGNAGSVGQVLVSQGAGMSPVWQDIDSVYGGDDWGSQVAQTSAPIVGDGTSGNPITLQLGVSAGEVLIYDGTSWTIRQAPWDSVCNTAVANMVQKWTGTELCNSQIYDDGTNVGIGTTSPTQKLDVAGNIQFTGALMPGGNAGSPGQVLVSQGPGSAPTWASVSGGGTALSCSNCPVMLSPYIDTSGNPGCNNSMSWWECAQACAKTTVGGFSDWRMPTLFELIELSRTTIDTTGYGCGFIWTATPLGYLGTRYREYEHLMYTNSVYGSYYPSSGYYSPWEYAVAYGYMYYVYRAGQISWPTHYFRMNNPLNPGAGATNSYPYSQNACRCVR